VRVDLWNLRTPENERDGTVTGPDGRTYARRTTRMARREADELLAGGTPVVLDLYADGRLEWCDGDDARSQWAGERAYLTTSEPTAKQLAKHAHWTAGLWQAGDGSQIVYLTGHC